VRRVPGEGRAKAEGEEEEVKIYVCGGSSELDLVAGYMRKLRDAGHEITKDWVATIRATGDANPRTATHKQRLRWSGDDLAGIEDARLVWVILPVKTSFGCAFEAGYAIGHGYVVIMSGDWRRTIFSSQALARFNEHDHALEWIRIYTTPGSSDDELGALEAE
jgi:hypothetical protein